jgi:cell wall-associated NlpC family hydrolase
LPEPLPYMRELVVKEARSWLGTPYHHMGRIKGTQGGVDCLTFLAEVYERAGVIDHIDIPLYTRDVMLHSSDEGMLESIQQMASKEVLRPLPGDIVLFRQGRVFAHAGIVAGWPRIIHPVINKGVVQEDVLPTRPIYYYKGQKRPMKFLTPFNVNPNPSTSSSAR